MSNAPTYVLSADDIFSGGDNAMLPFELPITKNGQPMTVGIKPVTAGAIVDFLSEGAVEFGPDGKPVLTNAVKQQLAMTRLITRTVCDLGGRPLFDEGNLELTRAKMPLNVFNALQAKLTEMIGEAQGAGKDSAVPDGDTAASTPTPTEPIPATTESHTSDGSPSADSPTVLPSN